MRYIGVLASGFLIGVLAEKAGMNPYQAIIYGLINTIFVMVSNLKYYNMGTKEEEL